MSKQQTTGRKARQDRRKVISALASSGVVAGAALLQGKWQKPVVERIIVPAHADTTMKPESDRRLKEEIVRVATIAGVNFYRWRWNALATSTRGLTGESRGVIAQEIRSRFPDVVGSCNGILTVDYRKLLKYLRA